MNSKTSRTDYRKEIINLIAAFPAMPALSGQFLRQINNPNLDFKNFAEDIKYDPGMTANILKIANSAYFGFAGQIDSLHTAFVRLGSKRLFQIGIAIGVSGILNRPLKGYDLHARDLLKHCVWTAVAAEELAQILKIPNQPILFTAGLLHDLGKIILDSFVTDEWDHINELIKQKNQPFEAIEHSILGIDHAEVGSELLKKWNFPEELVSAARWHHSPESAGSNQRVVSIIHIADILSYSEGIGTGYDGFHYRISADALNKLNVKTATIEKASARTLEKMQELERQL